MSDIITLDQIRTDNEYDLISLHEDENVTESFDSPCQYVNRDPVIFS